MSGAELSTRDGRAPWPSAVLWDMDGTLFDSEKLWDVPLFELTEKLGGALSVATRQAMVGTNVPTTMRLLFAEVDVEPTEDDVREAVARIDHRMADLFRDELVVAPRRPRGAARRARDGRAHGAGHLDRARADRDRPGHHRSGALRRGRLRRRGGPANKPHPEPYLRAARLLGVDPADTVAIEDSPTGTASAAAAGCTVLVVPCEVPVEPGERRVFRDSLEGVNLAFLAGLAPR